MLDNNDIVGMVRLKDGGVGDGGDGAELKVTASGSSYRN